MAPRYLQPYSPATFSSSLTHIDRLIHALDCIKNFTKPCEPCMIHLIHEIASHLNSLLAIGPSKNIAEELIDMNRLTKLSRQLLELDWLGVTHAIWTLVDRKINSLYDTRLAVPISNSWYGSCNGVGREESLAGQKVQRKRRPQRIDFNVGERDKDELIEQPSAERAPFSESNVVERIIDEQVQEPRPPRSGISSFEVVERDVHRQVEEPTPHAPNLNVVERTVPGQIQEQRAPSARSSLVERAGDRQLQRPRSLASDFEVIERRNKTQRTEEPTPCPSNINVVARRIVREPTVPRASSSNFNVVERTPSRQRPALSSLSMNTIPPSVIERLLGSLGSIIAELERDDAGNEGPSAQQGLSSTPVEATAGLLPIAESAVDIG